MFDLNNPKTLLVNSAVEDALINDMSETAFRRLLSHGYNMKLSDISLQEKWPVMAKINNFVVPITRFRLTREQVSRAVSLLHRTTDGDESPQMIIMSGQPAKMSYTFKVKDEKKQTRNVRYRVFINRNGERGFSVRMRLNNDDIFNLSDIGMSEESPIYQHMFASKGLNLITGAVDSGKTTLMYALLKHYILHSGASKFIDTYENPIEADLEAVALNNMIYNMVVSQAPVPSGVKDFLDGIMASLRRNSDIILLGEARTSDEIKAVVDGVGLTGKLFMATLHTINVSTTFTRLQHGIKTSSAAETDAKLYDMIEALNLVVSQKLLSTVDKKRVAVNEHLYLDNAIKKELHATPMEKLARKVQDIMNDNNATMVHKAKVLLDDGTISTDEFQQFKLSFADD
jgi:defect in organelle trafficking protein DotB